MEPKINFITSSTAKIEVGMRFPTVESLTKEWDDKDSNPTERDEAFFNTKVWYDINDGGAFAYYHTEDKTTDTTKPETRRVFYVQKMDKSFSTYTIFACENIKYEPKSMATKNTVFHKVYLGNQIAIDKNFNGIVDEGDITIADSNIEERGYTAYF